MTPGSVWIRVAWIAAALWVATPAMAEPAAADVLFDQGRALMDQKRFAEALEKLTASQRLDPGSGTLLNVAVCYAELGRTASAWSTYRDAAAFAARAGQSDREKYALSKADEIRPRLSTVTILLTAEARVDRLRIARNGEPVPEALWGTAVPVDPGPSSVEASAPGRVPVTMNITVQPTPGDLSVAIPVLAVVAVPLTAPLPEKSPPPSAAPPPAKDEGAASQAGDTRRVWGWVVGGTGVAALAVAGVVYLDSQATIRDANCPQKRYLGKLEYVCTREVDAAEHAAGRDEEIVSGVVAGLGAALVGTGIVLLVTAPSDPARSARTTLRASTDAATLTFDARF